MSAIIVYGWHGLGSGRPAMRQSSGGQSVRQLIFNFFVGRVTPSSNDRHSFPSGHKHSTRRGRSHKWTVGGSSRKLCALCSAVLLR